MESDTQAFIGPQISEDDPSANLPFSHMQTQHEIRFQLPGREYVGLPQRGSDFREQGYFIFNRLHRTTDGDVTPLHASGLKIHISIKTEGTEVANETPLVRAWSAIRPILFSSNLDSFKIWNWPAFPSGFQPGKEFVLYASNSNMFQKEDWLRLLNTIGQALVSAGIEPGPPPTLRVSERAKTEYPYLSKLSEPIVEQAVFSEGPYSDFFYFSSDKTQEVLQYAKSLDEEQSSCCPKKPITFEKLLKQNKNDIRAPTHIGEESSRLRYRT